MTFTLSVTAGKYEGQSRLNHGPQGRKGNIMKMIEEAYEVGPVLLLDGARGIYIPQNFCEVYEVLGVNPEEVDICKAGPEAEDYWEVWDCILRNGYIKIDGKAYTLYHQEDLWALPIGFDDEEFFG